AKTEGVLDQRHIHIQHAAHRTISADAELRLKPELAHVGVLETLVDDTRGTAKAEEDGVGATLDIHTRHIIRIHRDARWEEVARPVGGIEAAHASAAIGVD